MACWARCVDRNNFWQVLYDMSVRPSHLLQPDVLQPFRFLGCSYGV
jgi:hypothetical protein